MVRRTLTWSVLGAALATAVACSSGGSGGTTSQCRIFAQGYIGGAGQCQINADCLHTSRHFDCYEDGGCSCIVNDASTRTVPFDPKYCEYSVDAGNEPNVAQARAACGW